MEDEQRRESDSHTAVEVKRFNLTFLQVLAIDKIQVQFSVWNLRTRTATLALIEKCVRAVPCACAPQRMLTRYAQLGKTERRCIDHDS